MKSVTGESRNEYQGCDLYHGVPPVDLIVARLGSVVEKSHNFRALEAIGKHSYLDKPCVGHSWWCAADSCGLGVAVVLAQATLPWC
jgi:hypothetical protein